MRKENEKEIGTKSVLHCSVLNVPIRMRIPLVRTRRMRGFVMMSSCLFLGGLCITNGSTASTPRLCAWKRERKREREREREIVRERDSERERERE